MAKKGYLATVRAELAIDFSATRDQLMTAPIGTLDLPSTFTRLERQVWQKVEAKSKEAFMNGKKHNGTYVAKVRLIDAGSRD